MVSGGTVNGDMSSVTSAMQSFASAVSETQGSWKGASSDSIQAKVSECASSFSSTISSQMNAFAEACNLYEEYIQAKRNLEIATSNYNNAVRNKDNNAASQYQSNMSSYESKIRELKSRIQSLLSSAASQKLEATPIAAGSLPSAQAAAQASAATATSTTPTSSGMAVDWTKDDNFTYYAQGGGWNNYRYSSGGSNTMGKSGCGPVSMAMVLSSLGYNVNPNTAADWSADHGYHPQGGTDEGFFTAYANELGVNNRVLGKSSQNIKSALQNNELVILHVGPGSYNFTNYGHFMVARGYDSSNNKILIADPNRKANGKWYDLDEVVTQLKGEEASWAYSRSNAPVAT